LAVLAGCAAPVAPAPAGEAAPAAGAEAAAPEGGVTITWATIAGFYTDWAKEVAKEWEDKTGNTVNFVDMDLPTMYEQIVLESVADTGAYDIVTWDVGWQSEWANSGYLLELDPYIEASDPAELQLEDISPSLLRTTGMFNGKYYGLPYYTFTMGMFYRCDLFEDEGEMAAFEAEYGYPLDIPTTYEQMADIAAFFRRAPGETLKGEPVEQDFYGIGPWPRATLTCRTSSTRSSGRGAATSSWTTARPARASRSTRMRPTSTSMSCCPTRRPQPSRLPMTRWSASCARVSSL
jgi:multiple sugar transport system substrate-binding protein